MVGGDERTTTTGLSVVPTMGGHPWWVAMVPPAGFLVLFVGSLTDPSRDASPLQGALLIAWLIGAVALGWGASAERVTIEGTVVTVHRRWSTTRFDLADIRAVIETSWSSRGPLRVDGAERRVAGRRLPRLAPWSQLVTTSVHPAFWVRRAGLPEALVRGGGLLARRRGLR